MKLASKAVVSADKRKAAKRLRGALTPQERRVWFALRERLPVEGTHFRRQVVLGPYIVDFCCLRSKLVIEIDGNQHGDPDQQAYDLERTHHLEAQGFRVIRFSNHDVTRSLDSVLDTIHAVLHGDA